MSTFLALNCSPVSCCSLVFVPSVSIYLSLIRQVNLGWGLISQPNFGPRPLRPAHSCQVVMPLTAAQVRGAITSNPWTKDFRHLQPFPINYLKRYVFRDILVKAAKPHDRIKYWNIVPGDRVRVIGDKEGKVLEVSKINKLSNCVYLKGVTSNVRTSLLLDRRVHF